MASLVEEINTIHSENRDIDAEAVEQAEADIKRQKAQDQSRIALIVIWTFVLAIMGIFMFVLGSIAVASGSTAWKDPAEFLSGAVSSVLLPIVTLVLGYYFGKEKSG